MNYHSNSTVQHCENLWCSPQNFQQQPNQTERCWGSKESGCDNLHRTTDPPMKLTRAPKLLVSIILYRLFVIRGRCTHETRAGSRIGRRYLNHIRQVSEHRDSLLSLRSPPSLIWKCRSTDSFRQFCGAAPNCRVCQRNSPLSSYIPTVNATF